MIYLKFLPIEDNISSTKYSIGEKANQFRKSWRIQLREEKMIKKYHEETNPKVVESPFNYRKRFIKKGRLEYYLKYQLDIVL